MVVANWLSGGLSLLLTRLIAGCSAKWMAADGGDSDRHRDKSDECCCCCGGERVASSQFLRVYFVFRGVFVWLPGEP